MDTKEEPCKYEVCIGKFPCTRFVYTFSYTNEISFEKLIEAHTECKSSTDKGIEKIRWELQALHDNEQNELFEHISDLIISDKGKFNKSIGASLKIANFEEMQLQYKEKIKKEVAHKSLNENEDHYSYINFNIKNIWLVLFKTNIGFIVVDTYLDKDCDLDSLINFNYIFKSLKLLSNNQKNLLEIKKIELSIKVNDTEAVELLKDIKLPELNEKEKFRRIEDPEALEILRSRIKSKYEKCSKGTEVLNINDIKLIKRNSDVEISFRFEEKNQFDYKDFFVSKLLMNINIDTFFNSFESKSYEKRLPTKAHVFTIHSIKNDRENQIPELLYWLRKGYKKTYSPSESAKSLENNEEVLRSFSDSIWGVSREAVANIVYEGSVFLNENYHSRLDIYFYLYLLVLHQYYGLLLIARDAAELSSKSSNYLDPEEYKKLKDIKGRLNFFYLKCIFHETSHISHQSTLYKYMWDRLGVQSIQQEIQYEIERIASIIDEVREEDRIKQEEVQKKQQEIQGNRNKKFIIIAAIFTLVSTFEAVWSIFNMAKDSYDKLGAVPIKFLFFNISPPHIITVLTISLVLLSCIAGFSIYAIMGYANGRNRKNK